MSSTGQPDWKRNRAETSFTYDLQTKVVIEESGESGTVVGQAHFLDGGDQFMVRYKAGDERAVEVWWAESALALA